MFQEIEYLKYKESFRCFSKQNTGSIKKGSRCFSKQNTEKRIIKVLDVLVNRIQEVYQEGSRCFSKYNTGSIKEGFECFSKQKAGSIKDRSRYFR